MGFFSDLKEDLSQAVNELVPEEGAEAVPGGAETMAAAESIAQLQAAAAEAAEAAELAGEEAYEADVPVEEFAAAGGSVSEKDMEGELASLLDQLDEKPPVSPVSGMSGSYRQTADKAVGGFSTRSAGVVSDETAVITSGMKIVGDVVSEGSMDLTGTIEGNIDILGKLNVTGAISGNSKASEIYAENAKVTGEVRSEGSVKIGQSSVIIGNIFAGSAVIAGAVKGDIDVHGPVILDSTAIVMGNIKSKSVQINNGAVIEGLCSQCYADVNPTSFFEEIKKGKK